MDHLKFLIAAGACAFHATVFSQSNTGGGNIENGKVIYEQSCLACHQADGSGVPGLAPPLIHGTFVNGEKAKLIKILLEGMEGVEIKGEVYANPMPAFDYLSDQEIADVLTYVRGHFKNEQEGVSAGEVKAMRKSR